MGDGIFLLIPILFPIVAGLVVFAINHRIARQIYVGTVLVPAVLRCGSLAIVCPLRSVLTV